MPSKGRPKTHDARIVSVSMPSDFLNSMEKIGDVSENRSQWIVEAVKQRIARSRPSKPAEGMRL